MNSFPDFRLDDNEFDNLKYNPEIYLKLLKNKIQLKINSENKNAQDIYNLEKKVLAWCYNNMTDLWFSRTVSTNRRTYFMFLSESDKNSFLLFCMMEKLKFD